MTNKLVLIDGYSITFRAFYALTLLKNKKGIYTNAIYGFSNMLQKIIKEEQPTHMLVAFDAGRTTFRHEFFEAYKSGRQETPPELSEQIPFIRELVVANGIVDYELENYEADDIIGTIARKGELEGFEVKIITGDRDLTQLASEHITVSITKKGLVDVENNTPAFLQEKYQLSPAQIVDLKGLMGDASDNIPGVPGVGEKTALKLLHEFGSVENVIDSIANISGKKLVENLTNFREQALLSKRLATIETKAPINITFEAMKYNGPDNEKLRTLYKELEFQSHLDKLTNEESQIEFLFEEKLKFSIIQEITAEMLDFTEISMFVEVLDTDYLNGEILGIGLATRNGVSYIPLDVAKQSVIFQNWASDENKKKVVYDAKRCIVAFKKYGIDLAGVSFDALLASYILNPAEQSEDLAAISQNYIKEALQPDVYFYGKGAKQTIPAESLLSEHIVRKTKALAQIHPLMVEALKAHSQIDLLMELELPLTTILAQMELTGVRVDQEHLANMKITLQDRLKVLEQTIYDLAGEQFNINSPKQLGVLLFEKLGLTTKKKTKTGFSTSADVLEEIENQHPIIREILNYRQLGKLQSTYIEGLLKEINQDGKIHTQFNQALAQTGRLSSNNPNLQNIPIRLEEGRKIRQAFIPTQADWLIFAADYSQIELRVLAHISQDQKMIEAFQQDFDIHTKTAMDVFGVKKEDVTANMRRTAKAVNFGIVYGISDYGLSQNLGISRREAKDFIERYLGNYPNVQEYMHNIVLEAKRQGYVETLLKRRRYISEINSRNFHLRGFAERTAMNTPIQGSAADIIKLAMIRMQRRLDQEKLQTNMLLQVHDELIFEAPEKEIEILKKIVPEEMGNAFSLVVPLKVDFAFGKTWYDAK